jgi:predicted MFS family arabinose efflux permease
VVARGYSAAFLALAAIAAACLVLFWLAMPESRDIDRRTEALPQPLPRRE